ncbi:hypothetical protein I5U18_15855 [Serratia ureilytica]|uniref:hypothetical protein n=1 Tax=Serratia ureilytica TaxID=300181 RepID=UPI0018D469ED|nr:hypothetical protein [Serratia ureilytica]MBH1912048.1 hypothetical protein [Serratia ureilytica]
MLVDPDWLPRECAHDWAHRRSHLPDRVVDVAGVGLDVSQRAAHAADLAADNVQLPIGCRHIEAIGAQPFQQSEQGAAVILAQEVANDCRFMLPVSR